LIEIAFCFLVWQALDAAVSAGGRAVPACAVRGADGLFYFSFR